MFRTAVQENCKQPERDKPEPRPMFGQKRGPRAGHVVIETKVLEPLAIVMDAGFP
jgi:hypothetical protein